MDPILHGLNAAQLTAVTSPSDVLQVLAPPGSGKTKTLTSRVAYLLQNHHYKPWNVICLTFTIKSSKEMKERIAKLIDNGIGSKIILGTFHSVCRRYLVSYGHKLGIPKDFGIADSSDSIAIIRRIIKRLGVSIDPKKAQSRISSSKSRGITCAEVSHENAKKRNVEQHDFSLVFEAYQSQLTKSNLLDYDDLLLRTVDLLGRYPDCVSNVEAVLIDEFQDTNLVQFDLMRLFAAKNKRVTTVGDPDQSIYGWRSAEIGNLKRMQKEFHDILVIHLEENYRSSAAILLAAQEVIEQDESRPSKHLMPTHCPGTKPVLRRLPSAEIEASWIVSEILRVVGLTGGLLTFDDFAILLRSAALSRQIEAAMGRAGIAYRMVGGQKFFDRTEVKILLDYLRVISQPHNNDAVARIVNIPARGVGATTAKGLLEEAEARNTSFWSLIREYVLGRITLKTKISKAAEQGLGSFITIILTSQRKLKDLGNLQSPEHILRLVIKKLGFKSYVERHHAEDYEARWANVEELAAQAAGYAIISGNDVDQDENDRLPRIEGLEQQLGNAAEEALSKFLANVALATELQREEDNVEGEQPNSLVTISTMHASKGLEWPVVFVPSAYEGCIPHSRAEDTDEERRLLYVAMTRAQALLYLSCPTRSSQREETTLSPFLSTKKVGRLLSNKAPSINASTINDICRILRRDHPTDVQVFEASKNLQSYEDNLWPLSGEEDVKAIGSRWSKWDTIEHPSKRRRIKDDLVSNSVYTVSGIGSITTMQSGFTMSGNGLNGFVTAATRLEDIAREDAIRPKLPTKGRKMTADTIRADSRPISKIKVRGELGDQGNLMSLWGMLGKPKAEQDVLATRIDVGLSKDHDLPYQRETVMEFTSITSQTISARDTVPIRRSLESIPQALAGHRLQPLSSTSRSSYATTVSEQPKKEYIFLSSSPPPVEPFLEEAQARVNMQAHDVLASDSCYRGEARASPDMKPARTFHTTSVTQMQSAPKKTLGVRRSMHGWSGRVNPGFSVPRMAGSKR